MARDDGYEYESDKWGSTHARWWVDPDTAEASGRLCWCPIGEDHDD